jgi:uncharacterized protein YegL
MAKNENQANGKRQDRVHVGLLIDETGSMNGLEPAVVGGVNEFVEKLRADEAEAKVLATLAMFDLHANDPVVRVKFAGIPLDELTLLGPGDYRPRGATPLNDAVVATIRRMDKAVKKGERAMLVILTDGLENASETSSRDVRKLIHAREKKGWEFIYLGANQDAWAEADKIGLGDRGKRLSYTASPSGTADAVKLSAERARSFRDDPARYKAEAQELAEAVTDEEVKRLERSNRRRRRR